LSPGYRQPNPYEASGVKRADVCTTGAGWPAEEHVVTHARQAVATDVISVAGPSLKLHPTPIEGQLFPWRHRPRETVASADPTPEKPLCALGPVCSRQRGVSENTPRECQTRGRGSHGALGNEAPSRGARATVQSRQGAAGGSSSDFPTVSAVDKAGGGQRLSPGGASEAASLLSPLSG
jgi:hypothetical protein